MPMTSLKSSVEKLSIQVRRRPLNRGNKRDGFGLPEDRTSSRLLYD